MSRVGPLTVHSVFCPECGGWEDVSFQQVTKHEGFIICSACGFVIVLVRTVEQVVYQS